jgi:hypothetical protein
VLPPAIEGGPFAVLPCDRDVSPVVISQDMDNGEARVSCPVCGQHTPPMPRASLLEVLEKWNAMVDA